MDLIFSPIVVAICAGAAMVALVLAFRPTKGAQLVENRMTAYLRSGEPRESETPELEGTFFERMVLPALRGFLHLIGRLAPTRSLEALNAQLTMAGRPGNLSAADFMGIRLVILAACIGLAVFTGRAMANDQRLRLLVPGGCILVGAMYPTQWLKTKAAKRREAIQCALPDALDMLTICVEAGLAFESALQRVSDQWKGPLSDEFGRVVAEIRLGVPRPQALRRLAQRCDNEDVTSFVAVLVQADSMGTSIAHVLRSQADQIRVLRRQRAEEKANKAPIKVLVAMVLFIFPAIFVVILGPALPKLLEAFSGTGMP